MMATLCVVGIVLAVCLGAWLAVRQAERTINQTEASIRGGISHDDIH